MIVLNSTSIYAVTGNNYINVLYAIFISIDGFNEDLQNAFTSIKNQTEITDYTNLTSWNMEV